MAQAAFPFDPVDALEAAAPLRAPAPPAQGAAAERSPSADRVAFEIGWDHARHRLAPPPAHLHADSPVLHGWHAARSAFRGRTLRATRAVRAWLRLRLAAWMQGCAFEDVQVTPNFLQQLEVDACPITRRPLAPGASDAEIVRICRDAGYAAGNLAVVGTAAAAALATHGVGAALATARRIADGEAPSIDRLDAAEWTRVAVLQSFATRLPHADAAALPLTVLPPNRVRVLNPVQALQVVLTLLFAQPGYARRVAALSVWMPNAETRHAYHVFMHTLLARRIAAGATADAAAVRRALEDSWSDTLIQRRWQRLASRLTAADCEAVLRRAAARGIAGPAAQWLSDERAVDGWALGSRGRVQPADDAGARTPGSSRSSGSQKLASCAADTPLDAFQ
jgi:hypothetical protein